MQLRPRSLLVALALATFAPSAHADGEHARLTYEVEDGGGTCPTEAAFRAKVASRLGYDPFAAAASLALRVRITSRAGAATAEITAAAGKRTLTDPRCEALGDAVASAVAILLDPTGGPPPEPAADPLPVPPASEALPEPNPTTSARETPAPLPAAAEGFTPRVYADFTASFARAPAAMIGGRLGVGLDHGPWALNLEGRVETSPSDAVIGANDHVSSSAVSGAIAPCRSLEVFQLCGVLTLGSREVKALDVAQPSAQSSFFAAVGVRAGLEFPLSRAFALRANGEVGVPLLRTRYTTDGVERATTSIVEASLGTGIVGRFR